MIFLLIESLKWETGSSSTRKSERYVGQENIYINPEYISMIASGRDLEINGKITHTCYVSINEDSSFRVPYSADDFVDHLMESYQTVIARLEGSEEHAGDVECEVEFNEDILEEMDS